MDPPRAHQGPPRNLSVTDGSYPAMGISTTRRGHARSTAGGFDGVISTSDRAPEGRAGTLAVRLRLRPLHRYIPRRVRRGGAADHLPVRSPVSRAWSTAGMPLDKDMLDAVAGSPAALISRAVRDGQAEFEYGQVCGRPERDAATHPEPESAPLSSAYCGSRRRRAAAARRERIVYRHARKRAVTAPMRLAPVKIPSLATTLWGSARNRRRSSSFWR